MRACHWSDPHYRDFLNFGPLLGDEVEFGDRAGRRGALNEKTGDFFVISCKAATDDT